MLIKNKIVFSFVILPIIFSSTNVFADKLFSSWSSPVNLEVTSPGINTAAREGCQVLSPDGLSLIFASDRPNPGRDATRTDLDLWVAERKDKNSAFSLPYSLGAVINSIGDEVCPTVSTNGRYLYFASNREGGCGDRDLYLSVRQNKYDNLNWEAPVHLGCEINSTGRDHGASFFKAEENGTYLYFSSNRKTYNDNYKGHNIYRVKIAKNGLPLLSTLKIVEAVSSKMNDSRPFLRKDGLEIFFDRDIGDGNREDLWSATRNKHAKSFSNAAPIAILKSKGRNIRPTLNKDASILYFTSTRSTNSLGRADIWVSTRTEIDDDENKEEDSD